MISAKLSGNIFNMKIIAYLLESLALIAIGTTSAMFRALSTIVELRTNLNTLRMMMRFVSVESRSISQRLALKNPLVPCT